MREIINYIIEANLSLLLFLLAYKILLRGETNFRFSRFYLLFAIASSLTLPLISVRTGPAAIPSVSEVMPSHWLPEIVISGGSSQSRMETTNTAYDVWQLVAIVYVAGATFFLIALFAQLRNIAKTLRTESGYRFHKFTIIETAKDIPTFSFFHFISIGKADVLTPFEKEQIIKHEAVHAAQLHSIDILLVTALQVMFWFNPVINLYKKIFVELHEFEADARTVENFDVNNYCSLLARVALRSVHFPIASHFNQSLTLKRIDMMRIIKQKIKPWKFIVLAGITAMSFYIIACQDQLVSDLEKSTISQTGDYPAVVKADMEAYLKEHKEAKLTYMEGDPGEIDKLTEKIRGQQMVVNTYNINSGGLSKKGILLSNVTQYADQLQTNDNIFMVVEQQPEYPGGYDALRDFIRQNMKYPEAAKNAGTGGTVYVTLVINTDGSVSDAKVLKGVDPLLDAESVRVISMLPRWKPGMQNGKPVRVRFNIPVRWDVTSAADPSPASEFSQTLSKMKVSSAKTENAGKIIIQGTVTGEDDKPLPRTTVLVKGTTTGTQTDEQGKFRIEVPNTSGELILSYIGYEFKTLSY